MFTGYTGPIRITETFVPFAPVLIKSFTIVQLRKRKMPSMNNGNDSEVDGDLSENESGSSRDVKADSSEADDDSSELDESECDRRTGNYIKYLGE